MKNLMYLDFCYQLDIHKKLPMFRKEKKVYFTDPFIARAFEKKIVGKELVGESKMAEMIAFNALRAASEKIFVVKSNGETNFWDNGNLIEVKWKERAEARKNTIVLSKRDYSPRDSVFPLPVFLLFICNGIENYRL